MFIQKLKTIAMLVGATLLIAAGASLFLTALSFFISILLFIVPIVFVVLVLGVIMGAVKLKINPADIQPEPKVEPKKPTKKKASK